MRNIQIIVDGVTYDAVPRGTSADAPPPVFSGGARAFVPVGDYAAPVTFVDSIPSTMWETQGAANGPVTLALRVAATDTGIWVANAGPARGQGFTHFTGNIAGVPFGGRGGVTASAFGGRDGVTASAALSIGLNGSAGADVNLSAGDHVLTLVHAQTGGGELAVVFNKQP